MLLLWKCIHFRHVSCICYSRCLSYTTVYNRSRPKNKRSIQAKKHKGKGLFCFKKPPKAEDKDNENTKYQWGHVKNIKYSLFAKNPSKEAADDDQTNENRTQYFTDSNEEYAADDQAILYSADDKNYIRPGTSEGLSKTLPPPQALKAGVNFKVGASWGREKFAGG